MPVSGVLTILITMSLSIGFPLMLFTAFEIEYDVLPAILIPFISAVILTGIHFINKPKISIGVMIGLPLTAILLTALNVIKILREGVNAVLYYLQLYDFYGLPGTYYEPSAEGTEFFVFIEVYAVIAACIASYLLLQRKLIPLALLPYFPVFICSVANIVMTPSYVPCTIAAIGVFLVLLSYVFRNKQRKNAETELIYLIVPVVSLSFLFGGIFPMDTYDKDKLAKKILTSVRNTVEQVTSNSNNPLLEMINNALNGYMNPNSDLGIDIFTPIATMRTNLSKVGPFNPPQTMVMSVKRIDNPDYEGPLGRYESRTVYLKVETLDVYKDNNLTSSWIRMNPYNDDLTVESEEPQCFVEIKPFQDTSVDIAPYYTDFYAAEGEEPARTNPYNHTTTGTDTYAMSSLPSKTGNIYSERYLDEYVYGTCLEVPKSTERAVLVSDAIPAWFKDAYYGHSDLSDAEKVERVTEFVRTLHPYDANTDYPPKNVDFVPWFLNEAETGICVHYAATSMILLRMLGVPARYVRGYVDSRSYSSIESIVYATQAHAWFEVFIPDYGWVMNDATPGYAFDVDTFSIEGLAEVHPEVKTAGFSRDNYEYVPAETESTEETTEETDTDTSETTEPTLTIDQTIPSFDIVISNPSNQGNAGTDTSDSPDLTASSSTSPYLIINNNEPFFTENDLNTQSYEFYSELDSLGRCGQAVACLGTDLMPDGNMGSLESINPTAWQIADYSKYPGVIEGDSLYRKCQLIGFILTGETTNERNVITGTVYMKNSGMAKWEESVYSYLTTHPDNHVMYRVTPVYNGDNLLAEGVLMEARSVEDSGMLKFCVFAYNVQPNIIIDYATGENHISDAYLKSPAGQIFILAGQIKKALITILIVAAAVVLLFVLLKMLYIYYWNRQFTDQGINDRALAYYHYYGMISRVFGLGLPEQATKIAQKAAFGEGEISEKDLTAMKDVCRSNLAIISGGFTGIKRTLYQFLKIKI